MRIERVEPRKTRTGKVSHHAEPGTRWFTAIDGEGVSLPDGSHRYVVLGIGQDQVSNSMGLQFSAIMEFLYDHYKPQTAFVGFFLGYDFTQWFRTLPEERARMLLTDWGRAKRARKGRNPAPWPVEYDGWEFDILAMKRFKLRPACGCRREAGTPKCGCKQKPWMYVCDAGSFFQSSFLSVIDPEEWAEPIVTKEEYMMISRGKERRSNAVLDLEMKWYNLMENDCLERVMSVLDKGLRELGIALPPSKWFGPGQAAQAWLNDQRVTKTSDILGTDWEPVQKLFWEAARESYFGGWFEVMIHGHIPGVTWEYDINSAYPAIIAGLPCLEHGTYTAHYGRPQVAMRHHPYTLVRATVKGECDQIGAMLHRDKHGNISRPCETQGWYWLHEVMAAINAGIVTDVTWHERISYQPCDCLPPMRKVANLYARRQAVGKKTPLGKAIKLVLNSMYGKFAQSVGEPVYGNPVYASLITAGTRAMICRAIGMHPQGPGAVAMVATDAVFFTERHPGLPLSGKLGEWEETMRDNLTTFKPGVYWDDKARAEIRDEKSPHFKARGISARDFASQIGEVDSRFRYWTGVEWPRVTFTSSFSMVTCQQALQRGNWDAAGSVFQDVVRMQDSDPASKRVPRAYRDGRGLWRTGVKEPELYYVKVGDEYQAFRDNSSVPYEKRFGMDDPFSDASKEAMGVSPDGNVSELYGYLLKGITS